MDKTTSVLAAFEAGKIPSHEQVSDFIDWFNATIVPQATPDGGDELSAQGRIIANDLRQVLEAYNQLGHNKNHDNLLQECLWHLSRADISSTATNVVDMKEASKDAKNLGRSFSTIFSIIWSNMQTESSFLSADFVSFARLALSDAAELVEGQAKRAKEGLREVEEGVQEGDRTTLGRKKRRVEEEEEDVKKTWEHGMDAVKDAGSEVIGAGQQAADAAERTSQKASARVKNAYYQICDRAQNDREYHDALVNVFDTVQKWLTRSLDTAQDINKSTTLENFIDDPTTEQHVSQALRGFGRLLERLAGGKSLDDFYSKIRACVVDVRQDPDLQQWTNDFFTHLRKSLDESGYSRSDDAKARRHALSQRWHKLMDSSAESGQKWRGDWESLKREWEQFYSRIDGDEDLQRLRKVHGKMAEDLEKGLGEVAKQVSGEAEHVGSQVGGVVNEVMQQVAWFWSDMFKVYLPRVLDVMKDVPIPRTEYKDNEIEMVLENVELSSLKTNPSHIFIRNITDIDVSTTSASSQSAVGSLTRINIQAMQLQLKDVSFWYKDKTASLGPSEFTGLVGFTLPEKGVDVDFALRTLSASSPERSKLQSVIKLEKVSVTMSEDIQLDVKQSNHSMLISMFKPIFVMRFKEALEKVMEEWIRGSIEWIGRTMYDVGNRRVVFEDAGVSGGNSMIAAIWSEMGRIQREGRHNRGGRFLATGSGVVIEEQTEDGKTGAQFAMGAEPQILSGKKRGPLGTASEPLKDRVDEALGKATDGRMDINDVMAGAESGGDAAKRQFKGASEAARREAWKAKDAVEGMVEDGKERVKSFQSTVERKRMNEERRDGWQSGAFDVNV